MKYNLLLLLLFKRWLKDSAQTIIFHKSIKHSKTKFAQTCLDFNDQGFLIIDSSHKNENI